MEDVTSGVWSCCLSGRMSASQETDQLAVQSTFDKRCLLLLMANANGKSQQLFHSDTHKTTIPDTDIACDMFCNFSQSKIKNYN